MEGSLPVIGSMLEAPAALTKTADTASAAQPFAALLGQAADDPPAAPGGSGLPPGGPSLPPLPAVLNPVADPASVDLSADGTLQTPEALTLDQLSPAALSPNRPGLSGQPTVTDSTVWTVDDDALATAMTALVSTEAEADTPVLRHGATDPGNAGPSDAAGGDASMPIPGIAAAAQQVVAAARQPVAEPDPATTGSSGEAGALRGQERATSYLNQALLRDASGAPPPLQTTAPTVANTIRPDVAGLPLTPAAVAVPLSQNVTQAEPAGPEALDMPDLPFDSIRVSVRDPAADRPLAQREPAFHLPGPRQAVGDPQWARALGERLAVVVRGEHQTARMSLNPAHLGPIDIQLRLQDDQAQLWLTAQHPQARDALEAAMPRLREMFAQQGIDLSHQGTSGQQREQDADAGTDRPGYAARPGPDAEEVEAPTVHRQRGGALLDHYA